MAGLSTPEPVTPVDAATVILVRHGDPVGLPWQCFMVRRHVRSEFASDVYVFPGGKVDEADRDPEVQATVAGHPGPHLDGEIDVTAWRSVRLAAIRELFEEAGVLLADSEDGRGSVQSELAARLGRCRQDLHEGRATFAQIMRNLRLHPAADRLHPFSRWITPETFRHRYDTRFFLARLPGGQEPLHDDRETTDGVWIAPHEALERYRREDFPLVFATEKHLERLAGFASMEAAIAATALSDLQPVTPRVVEKDGERRFLLPGDADF